MKIEGTIWGGGLWQTMARVYMSFPLLKSINKGNDMYTLALVCHSHPPGGGGGVTPIWNRWRPLKNTQIRMSFNDIKT